VVRSLHAALAGQSQTTALTSLVLRQLVTQIQGVSRTPFAIPQGHHPLDAFIVGASVTPAAFGTIVPKPHLIKGLPGALTDGDGTQDALHTGRAMSLGFRPRRRSTPV
jgi:hypothetical protein